MPLHILGKDLVMHSGKILGIKWRTLKQKKCNEQGSTAACSKKGHIIVGRIVFSWYGDSCEHIYQEPHIHCCSLSF